MSLGLYQGGSSTPAADVGYQQLLDHALMPRVVAPPRGAAARRQQGQPRAGLRGAEELPDALHAGAVRRRFVQGLRRRSTGTRRSSARSRPSSARRSTQHLDAMLSHGAPPPAVPMDKNLVASVRDMLVAFPLEYRIFSRLKRGADRRRLPAVHAWRAPPVRTSLSVFERASGEPLTKGIPGLFTQGRLSQGVRDLGRQGDPPARRRGNAGCSACGRRTRRKSLPIGKANPELTEPGAAACTSRSTSRSGTSTSPTCAWSSSTASRRACRSRASSGRRRLAAGARSCAPWRARRTLVEPKPRRSARRAAPRSATSTRRPSRPSAEMAAVLGKVKVPGAEIAPTGPPLEKMVDDHFAPIRRLVAGTPPPIDEMHEDVQRGLRAARGRSMRRRRASRRRLRRRRRRASRPRRGSCPSRRVGAREARRRGRRPRARSVRARGPDQPSSSRSASSATGRSPGAIRSPRARRRTCCRKTSSQLFGAGGAFDDFYQRPSWPRWSTPAPTPWGFKPTGRRHQAGQRRGPGRLPARGADQGGLLPQRRQDAVVQGRHPRASRWKTA